MHLQRSLGSALKACLMSASVPISNTSVVPYNLRLPYRPLAVAAPGTVRHIEKSVECAAGLGVKVSTRSGGHGYTSSGLGGENGHLVVDMAGFDKVEVDAAGNARIGTGARLGEVALGLWVKGRGLSHGSCPGVGVGGHVLHGGWGTSSHLKGLALDWVVGATVTLADGSTVHASATENKDIFWAVRGAGSSFGVVSEMEFETFDAPDTTTPFTVNYDWVTRVPGSTKAAVDGLAALQEWLASGEMPPELWMNVGISEGRARSSGLFWGTEAGLRGKIGEFLESIGGTLVVSDGEMNWIDAVKLYAGAPLESPEPYNVHDTFYATSLTTPALTIPQLESFTNQWFNVAKSPTPETREWWIQFDLHGGKSSAIAAVPVNATAYPHRDKLLLWQFYDTVARGTEYPADGFGLLRGLTDSITGTMPDDSWGLYANYPDSRLDPADAAMRYWGVNLPRLRNIKKSVDPDDVFFYPQGVRPA